jgi:3-oxoacyl-[acyl-carrier protein] reductase
VDLGLSGKVAWVTGSAYGVGRAIAVRLASEGARVAVHYLRSEAEAQETVRAVRAVGAKCCLVRCDITDQAAAADAHRQILSELGAVDVLVNNAAAVMPKRFLESGWQDWEPQLRVSVLGTMGVTRLVLEGMVERGWGRVITITGDSGRVGESRLTAVAAARAAEIGFTKSLPREVGRHNVTVNAIALGLVQTPGSERHTAPGLMEKNLDRILGLYPMRRLGRPEDCAPLVALLASPLGGYITGQTISVSGGYTTV